MRHSNMFTVRSQRDLVYVPYRTTNNETNYVTINSASGSCGTRRTSRPNVPDNNNNNNKNKANSRSTSAITAATDKPRNDVHYLPPARGHSLRSLQLLRRRTQLASRKMLSNETASATAAAAASGRITDSKMGGNSYANSKSTLYTINSADSRRGGTNKRVRNDIVPRFY